MRMTSKGQVTIPSAIRLKLNLIPGDDVEFVEAGDEVKVRKVATVSPEQRRANIEAWLKRFAGSGDSGWTTDEILDMTRGRERRNPPPSNP